tara:strand:- start:1821 stop:3032 length:1212 start_codon:yes stop_codon:yes gene_type:complete
MIFLNTKLIFKVLIITTLSGSIVLFSDTNFFLKIFSFYNIDHLTPSFADFRSYQALPLTIEKGLDPYINHEYDPWKRPFNLPIIWFYISKYLNLINEINFKIFIFLYISLFIFCVIQIIELTENIIGKILVILAAFSASSILALERGNTDLLIFSLVFIACIQKKLFLSLLILITASILKLFPIFSFVINFENKKKVFLSILGILLVFFILLSDLKYFFYNTHSTFNTGLTFGIRPIILGFFKSLERVGLNNIEMNNLYFIIGYLFILFFSLLLFLFFLIKNKKKKSVDFINLKNRLFLAGSSIYCCSFIFFSSFDYRLIFLIMTIPYLTDNINLIKKLILILILLSTNFLAFYTFASSQNDFMYIGILNHISKLSLYILVLHELSKFFNIFVQNILTKKKNF